MDVPQYNKQYVIESEKDGNKMQQNIFNFIFLSILVKYSKRV
jgi:hypothetical protein